MIYGKRRYTRVLTVLEVAHELRCSKAHVHHLIAGKVAGVPPLSALRLGRRVLVRREALVRWMEWLECDGNSIAGA